MKINVFIEEGLIKNETKLEKFLNNHSKFLKFSIRSTRLKADEDYLVFPQSHQGLYEQLTEEEKNAYSNFFFTSTQYNDNYFFKSYKNLVPISFYAWEQLTPLPKENGILYSIIDYIILDIDKSDFRHESTTGCIFDFLWDKTGIDDGMRQARVCPECLSRIKEMNLSEDEKKIFEDLKLLMNEVSNSSKWDKNILEEFKYFRTSIFAKRNPKIEGQINIIIASPSDLIEERKILLNELAERFRADGHEENCGYRLIVHGWENIASQNGYVQDIINSRITESMDIVLAVFKHTVGTPTLNEYGDIRAESGTIEEFLLTMDDPSTSPLGMLYFYSKAPVISLDSPDSERIKENWDKLKEFKEIMKNKVIYKLYSDANELISLVIIDLVRNIKDYFEQEGHEKFVERSIQRDRGQSGHDR